MYLIMNIQDCFLIASNNHWSAAQIGDLEKLGNSLMPKFLEVATCKLVNRRKFWTVIRASRYVQFCNNNNILS